MLVDLFDVFHGCLMVFVSDNEKTGTLSHLFDVFMVFVSENEKTGTFSHLCLFYGFCQ